MEKKSQQLGYIEGWSSVVINTVLFGFKYWVGMACGSVAMIADAWHTLSDTLTSIVVLFGFWISGKPADKGHPYGHGRAELIASVIIGSLLAVVAFNFLSESIGRLRHFQSATFGKTAIIVFLVSFTIKEGLARFSIWAGRKINSNSLIADGWHHRSDAIASILIVGGAILGKYFWWIDGCMGIAVSLLIFWAVIDILKSAANTLMGEKLDSSLEKKITDIIKKVTPLIDHIHHFHMHQYGDHIELTVHVRLPKDVTLCNAHSIASEAEAEIRKQMHIETTIHLEPNQDEEGM